MDYIAENTNFKLKNSAVTLGKFDGLHLGHQLLLEQVISLKKQGYTAVMFSFSYHPGNLFSKKEFELIYTEEEKLAKLRNTKMDVLVSYPFTKETSNMEPEDFIKDVLIGKLDAKIIVVGQDFRFGHKRRGDVKLLQSLAETYGYRVIACEKRKYKDSIISSSEIRKELKEGNMETVNEMLGQPYSILGEVRHGRKLGRTLGLPTTNIIPVSGKLLPPCGVYASKTIVDGISYPGVTNIGFKPTVGAEKVKGVETYIFDFNQDLYGKFIEVELYTYERPELKFNSIEELKQKMQEDIAFTRNYFLKLNEGNNSSYSN
ncbi:bifunctional riboflavin kinase/FAD synthetase [Mobilitalea sibirica]|uniref:Riboflavin biosynthesis protein n=2 Tax=Mobilitalea sibirica TaxID=1462919 RepID=A0A8J7H4I1_9FIRM|nr:bifunctional riboflavin kinase/FAD synthetase [Mobilitalea sibirica]